MCSVVLGSFGGAHVKNKSKKMETKHTKSEEKNETTEIVHIMKMATVRMNRNRSRVDGRWKIGREKLFENNK